MPIVSNYERFGQQTSQTERVVDIVRVFHAEFPTWQKIYDYIEKGYNWLGGDQYEQSELEWYKSQRRPADVFNLIFPHVNTVLGDFLENEFRQRVFPKNRSNPQIAYILQDLLDHFHFKNDMKSVETETLLASLVKVGWLYPRYSDELEIDGAVKITNVDEFEMMFDSRSKDYFLDDAAYVCRSRWMTTDQILANWTHHKSKLQQILRDRKQSAYWEGISEDVNIMMHHNNFVMENEGKYRIIEFHEMEYEQTEIAYDPISREKVIIDVDQEYAKRWLKYNPNYQIVKSHAKVKKIAKLIPGLAFLLDDKIADLQDETYDYIPLFAYHYGKKTIENFGLFQNSFGPQHGFNEWHNRTADIINKTSGQTIGYKPSRVINAREVENYGTMTGGLVKFKDEANIETDYKRFDPPPFPAAADAMSREAMDLLPKILGITPNQMGFSETKQEPAQLFGMRVRQATKALSVIYTNLSRTRKRKSDKILRIMQQYYDGPRIVTILNKETMTTKELMLNVQIGEKIINDIRVGEYEVVMDDTDRNPTARAVRWELKNQLAQLIMSVFGPTAIDPRWWLKDADLGDIEDQIARIEQTIMGMIQTGQQSEALTAADQMIELANKRGGSQAQANPSPNNKKPASTPKK